MSKAVRWFSRRRVRFNSRHAVWRSVLALACLVTLSACGGSESTPVTPPTTPASNGTLTGRVIASDGTGGIPNATVTVGSARTSSGSDGNYTLSVPAADRTVVRVDAAGFAENVRLARVTAGQNTPLTIQLVRAGAAQTVSRASGGTVTLPNSTASLILPANGLLPQNGGTPAADVAISLTPITVAGTTSEMPGDFTTSTGGGIARIESFGALLVDIRDSNNVTYGLAPGSTATIRIPVSTRSSTIPPTIPLYYLDLVTGRWVEDGQATLGGSVPNRFYEGAVSRIAYWNADLVMETIVVSGCVRNDAGQPVDHALVESDGIDYSGSSQVFTASDGSFQIPIRKNGKATIAALVNSQLTNTVTAGPSGTNVAVQDCLTTTTSTGLSIKLTWGVSPSDVDSHLLTPNGDHVFFGAKGALAALPFASLDVDDRDSFGPEIVTITKLMQGTYTYAVHNFSGTFTPGLTESPTRVELNQNGQITVFTPPPGEGTKPWWDVVTIVVDAQCQVSVTPVNTWLDQAPPLSPAGTPVFCTVN